MSYHNHPEYKRKLAFSILEKFRNAGGGAFGEAVAMNFIYGAFHDLKSRTSDGSIGPEQAAESGEHLLEIIATIKAERTAAFIAAQNGREKKSRQSDRELAWVVFQKTDGTCSYCGVKLNPFSRFSKNGFHVDHAISKKNGGTNDIANLVPSCAACNISKSDTNADERGGHE